MKHTGPISCVASHGAYVATGGYDNRLILWDAASQTPLAQVWHDHLINHCSFSADGRWLVTSSSDYSARLWALPELRLCAVLAGHEDDVDMAVFSPDNQLIATCALDRALRVFDLNGRCLQRYLGHTGNIISLLWSSDGRQLVSSGVDGTVRVWDVASGALQTCYDLQGVRTDTIVLDDEGVILAGDDNGRIVALRADGVQELPAHQAGIKKLVYCPRRQLLVSLSYDRTLALWRGNARNGLELLVRTEFPAQIWPRGAALLDGERLALATFGGSYAVYDWSAQHWQLAQCEAGPALNALCLHEGALFSVGDAGVVLRAGQLHHRLGSLCNFLLSAGNRLYAGGQLGQVFDADSGAVLYQHHAPLNCALALRYAGQTCIAVGSYTGEILLLGQTPQGGLRLLRTLAAFPNAVKGLALDAGRLCAVCASREIAWYSLPELELMQLLPQAHEKIINACVALSGAGFATVARDRSLRLWLDQGMEQFPSPHRHSIKCMALSFDGLQLMTGSYGGTLAGFDLPSRSWYVWQRPTMAGIASLCYDPLQQCFHAASYDGEVYRVA